MGLVLVPCLIGDPVTAYAFGEALSPRTTTAPAGISANRFCAEALEAALAASSFGRPFAPHLTELLDRIAEGLGLNAEPQLAIAPSLPGISFYFDKSPRRSKSKDSRGFLGQGVKGLSIEGQKFEEFPREAINFFRNAADEDKTDTLLEELIVIATKDHTGKKYRLISQAAIVSLFHQDAQVRRLAEKLILRLAEKGDQPVALDAAGPPVFGASYIFRKLASWACMPWKNPIENVIHGFTQLNRTEKLMYGLDEDIRISEAKQVVKHLIAVLPASQLDAIRLDTEWIIANPRSRARELEKQFFTSLQEDLNERVDQLALERAQKATPSILGGDQRESRVSSNAHADNPLAINVRSSLKQRADEEIARLPDVPVDVFSPRTGIATRLPLSDLRAKKDANTVYFDDHEKKWFFLDQKSDLMPLALVSSSNSPSRITPPVDPQAALTKILLSWRRKLGEYSVLKPKQKFNTSGLPAFLQRDIDQRNLGDFIEKTSKYLQKIDPAKCADQLRTLIETLRNSTASYRPDAHPANMFKVAKDMKFALDQWQESLDIAQNRDISKTSTSSGNAGASWPWMRRYYNAVDDAFHYGAYKFTLSVARLLKVSRYQGQLNKWQTFGSRFGDYLGALMGPFLFLLALEAGLMALAGHGAYLYSYWHLDPWAPLKSVGIYSLTTSAWMLLHRMGRDLEAPARHTWVEISQPDILLNALASIALFSWWMVKGFGGNPWLMPIWIALVPHALLRLYRAPDVLASARVRRRVRDIARRLNVKATHSWLLSYLARESVGNLLQKSKGPINLPELFDEGQIVVDEELQSLRAEVMARRALADASESRNLEEDAAKISNYLPMPMKNLAAHLHRLGLKAGDVMFDLDLCEGSAIAAARAIGLAAYGREENGDNLFVQARSEILKDFSGFADLFIGSAVVSDQFFEQRIRQSRLWYFNARTIDPNQIEVHLPVLEEYFRRNMRPNTLLLIHDLADLEGMFQSPYWESVPLDPAVSTFDRAFRRTSVPGGFSPTLKYPSIRKRHLAVARLEEKIPRAEKPFDDIAILTEDRRILERRQQKLDQEKKERLERIARGEITSAETEEKVVIDLDRFPSAWRIAREKLAIFALTMLEKVGMRREQTVTPISNGDSHQSKTATLNPPLLPILIWGYQAGEGGAITIAPARRTTVGGSLEKQNIAYAPKTVVPVVEKEIGYEGKWVAEALRYYYLTNIADKTYQLQAVFAGTVSPEQQEEFQGAINPALVAFSVSDIRPKSVPWPNLVFEPPEIAEIAFRTKDAPPLDGTLFNLGPLTAKNMATHPDRDDLLQRLHSQRFWTAYLAKVDPLQLQRRLGKMDEKKYLEPLRVEWEQFDQTMTAMAPGSDDPRLADDQYLRKLLDDVQTEWTRADKAITKILNNWLRETSVTQTGLSPTLARQKPVLAPIEGPAELTSRSRNQTFLDAYLKGSVSFTGWEELRTAAQNLYQAIGLDPILQPLRKHLAGIDFALGSHMLLYADTNNKKTWSREELLNIFWRLKKFKEAWADIENPPRRFKKNAEYLMRAQDQILRVFTASAIRLNNKPMVPLGLIKHRVHDGRMEPYVLLLPAGENKADAIVLASLTPELRASIPKRYVGRVETLKESRNPQGLAIFVAAGVDRWIPAWTFRLGKRSVALYAAARNYLKGRKRLPAESITASPVQPPAPVLASPPPKVVPVVTAPEIVPLKKAKNPAVPKPTPKHIWTGEPTVENTSAAAAIQQKPAIIYTDQDSAVKATETIMAFVGTSLSSSISFASPRIVATMQGSPTPDYLSTLTDKLVERAESQGWVAEAAYAGRVWYRKSGKAEILSHRYKDQVLLFSIPPRNVGQPSVITLMAVNKYLFKFFPMGLAQDMALNYDAARRAIMRIFKKSAAASAFLWMPRQELAPDEVASAANHPYAWKIIIGVAAASLLVTFAIYGIAPFIRLWQYFRSLRREPVKLKLNNGDILADFSTDEGLDVVKKLFEQERQGFPKATLTPIVLDDVDYFARGLVTLEFPSGGRFDFLVTGRATAEKMFHVTRQELAAAHFDHTFVQVRWDADFDGDATARLANLRSRNVDLWYLKWFDRPRDVIRRLASRGKSIWTKKAGVASWRPEQWYIRTKAPWEIPRVTLTAMVGSIVIIMANLYLWNDGSLAWTKVPTLKELLPEAAALLSGAIAYGLFYLPHPVRNKAAQHFALWAAVVAAVWPFAIMNYIRWYDYSWSHRWDWTTTQLWLTAAPVLTLTVITYHIVYDRYHSPRIPKARELERLQFKRLLAMDPRSSDETIRREVKLWLGEPDLLRNRHWTWMLGNMAKNALRQESLNDFQRKLYQEIQNQTEALLFPRLQTPLDKYVPGTTPQRSFFGLATTFVNYPESLKELMEALDQAPNDTAKEEIFLESMTRIYHFYHGLGDDENFERAEYLVGHGRITPDMFYRIRMRAWRSMTDAKGDPHFPSALRPGNQDTSILFQPGVDAPLQLTFEIPLLIDPYAVTTPRLKIGAQTLLLSEVLTPPIRRWNRAAVYRDANKYLEDVLRDVHAEMEELPQTKWEEMFRARARRWDAKYGDAWLDGFGEVISGYKTSDKDTQLILDGLFKAITKRLEKPRKKGEGPKNPLLHFLTEQVSQEPAQPDTIAAARAGSPWQEQWLSRKFTWLPPILAMGIGTVVGLAGLYAVSALHPQWDIPFWVVPLGAMAASLLADGAFYLGIHKTGTRNGAAWAFAGLTGIAAGLSALALAWALGVAATPVVLWTTPILWKALEGVVVAVPALNGLWDRHVSPRYPNKRELKSFWQAVEGAPSDKDVPAAVQQWVEKNVPLHSLDWLRALQIMAQDAVDQGLVTGRIFIACGALLSPDVNNILTPFMTSDIKEFAVGHLPIATIRPEDKGIDVETRRLFGAGGYAHFPVMVHAFHKAGTLDPRLVLYEDPASLWPWETDKTLSYLTRSAYLAALARDYLVNGTYIGPASMVRRLHRRRGDIWLDAMAQLLQDQKLRSEALIAVYRNEKIMDAQVYDKRNALNAELDEVAKIIDRKREEIARPFKGEENPLLKAIPLSLINDKRAAVVSILDRRKEQGPSLPKVKPATVVTIDAEGEVALRQALTPPNRKIDAFGSLSDLLWSMMGKPETKNRFELLKRHAKALGHYVGQGSTAQLTQYLSRWIALKGDANLGRVTRMLIKYFQDHGGDNGLLFVRVDQELKRVMIDLMLNGISKTEGLDHKTLSNVVEDFSYTRAVRTPSGAFEAFQRDAGSRVVRKLEGLAPALIGIRIRFWVPFNSAANPPRDQSNLLSQAA